MVQLKIEGTLLFTNEADTTENQSRLMTDFAEKLIAIVEEMGGLFTGTIQPDDEEEGDVKAPNTPEL